MAVVRLGRFEIEEGRLPKICMRCGVASAVTREMRFRWNPSLPAVHPGIAMVFMSKRMTIETPLCQTHRNHFFMNNLLTWLCLLAIVLFGVIVVAIEVHTNDSGQAKSRDPDAFLVAGSWIGIALIVGVAFVQKKAIRPTEVTANSITLAGVSDAFVAALKEKRKKMREIDDQTSPPMRDGPLLEVEEVEPLDEED